MMILDMTVAWFFYTQKQVLFSSRCRLQKPVFGISEYLPRKRPTGRISLYRIRYRLRAQHWPAVP